MAATTKGERVGQVVTEMLDVLDTATPERGYGTVPMSHFRPMYPLTFGRGWKELNGPEGEGKFFGLGEFTPDVMPRFDVTAGMFGNEPGVKLKMYRIRTVGVRALRGKVRRLLPHPVEFAFLHVHDDGTYFSGKRYAGWLAGEWQTMGTTSQYLGRGSARDQYSGDDSELFQRSIRLAQSIAYTKDTEWRVRIGRPGRLKLEIPTDPAGIRAVFKLRDVPPGKQRRAALRNWVREHWRQNRVDPDIEGLVRQHLRGGLKFTWDGFECEVIPSEMDLRIAERKRIEREQAREDGTDARVRLFVAPLLAMAGEGDG